ncbi:MAG: hypothetical protein DWQ08_03695 [Proteobacteria bacterium]|nr:MAG: hypothetical protein DWQ08_03695 [Pseudomonadota bacterium]
MKGLVPPDPETDVSSLRYACVKPPRSRRKRLPFSCVTVCDSAAEAMARAAREPGLRPAEVLGPSKSSEGQFIYYLVRWLDG